MGHLYEIDERDRVVPLRGAPGPSGGAPMPTVVSDGAYVELSYYVRGSELSSKPDHMAIIRFDGLFSLYFGQPDYDWHKGHPLDDRGLSELGFGEVLHSSWIRHMTAPRQLGNSSVHWDIGDEWRSKLRHFVFGFHDESFECIAMRAEVREVDGRTREPIGEPRAL